VRQLILSAPGQFQYRSVTPPAIGPGEALVRMERIGVCGSDFHAFTGTHPAYVYPRVLGHELGGTVVSVQPNNFGISVGDRCAINPYINCQSCRMCKIGRTNCCERLEVLGVHRDGGMQNLLVVPTRLLYRSAILSLDELALVETLGIGAHAVARSNLRAGESALVVGAGPIGLGVALFAREAGGNVTVVERSEKRRTFSERMGWKVLPSLNNLWADVVFDATGNCFAMNESLHHVDTGGRLVYVGLTSDPVQLNDSVLHKREITLLASRNSVDQFSRIIHLLEAGTISVKDWVTHRLEMSELATQFQALPATQDLIKAIVSIDHTLDFNDT
jgi:2-desacetyl-2-hydroxyethyl bacteriochlorophyllide A dehydrogenase